MQEKSQNAETGEKSEGLTNSEKGKKAEELFQNHLNTLGIPFYYIDQSKESFSDIFHEKQIHRPDFIVCTKRETFYVDVKNRTKTSFGPENEKRFRIDQYIIRSLYNFQNELHLPVWVAFTDNLIEPDFYYAPVSELYEYFKTISGEINKKCSKEDCEKFEECLICIPDVFLYNHFSFDNGFLKRHDSNFYEAEIENHIKKAGEIRNPGALKGARINKYKKH
jgi:hypothetical protein